jgi:hypothetical protein
MRPTALLLLRRKAWWGFLFMCGYVNIILCYLLSNSFASEFCMPAFQNALSVPYSDTRLWRWNKRNVRNFGIQNSDAVELTRRKQTTFRKRRKFDIKNVNKSYTYVSCVDGSYFSFFIIPKFKTRDFLSENSWSHLFLNFLCVRSISGKILLTLWDLHYDLHNRL